MDHVQWCSLGASVVLNIAKDKELGFRGKFAILENSVLRTKPEASYQIGHFDLEVKGPPKPSRAPLAIIAVTPP